MEILLTLEQNSRLVIISVKFERNAKKDISPPQNSHLLTDTVKLYLTITRIFQRKNSFHFLVRSSSANWINLIATAVFITQSTKMDRSN